ELTYEGLYTDNQLPYPAGVLSTSPPSPGLPGRYTVTFYDLDGNLQGFRDYGDVTTSSDDIWSGVHYATFTGQHFTAPDQVTTYRSSDTTVLAQRQATYTVTSGRPQLTQVRDVVMRGNQPGTTTPYNGQTSAYNITYDPADFGNIKTFAD